MAIDPGTPAMASRRMKGELHHMILRTAREASFGPLCVHSCIRMTASNYMFFFPGVAASRDSNERNT